MLPIRFLVASAALTACLPFSTALAQATIHVPSQAPSIQSAIDQAVSGDTVLVAPGTYAVNSLTTRGKVLHLVSEAGASATTLTGGGASRVFYIHDNEGIATVVEGFTIRDGKAANSSSGTGSGGGAILVSGASPLFRDCIVTSSNAGNGGSSAGAGGHGGGLYVSNGSPRFERCIFSHNFAGTGGQGAKGANGADGTILSHHADNGGTGKTGGNGGNGGAVYVTGSSSDPIFANCLFTGNRAGSGGKGGTGGSGGDGYTFSLAAGDGGDGGKGGKGGDAGHGTVFVTSGAKAQLTSCTFGSNLSGYRGSGGNGGSAGSGEPNGSNGSSGSTGSFSTYAGLYAASGPVELYNCALWDHDSYALAGPPIGLTEVAGIYSALNSAARTTISGTNCFLLPSSGMDASWRPLASGALIDAGNETLLPNWTAGDLAGHLRSFDRPGVAGVSALDIGAYENTEAEWLPMGCGTNAAGSLTALSGLPTIGTWFTLGVDDPTGFMTTGSIAILSVNGAALPGPCGSLVPGFGLDPSLDGALLVDQGTSIALKIAGGWAGPGNPVPFVLPLPEFPSLVGASLFCQGAMLDIATFRLAAGQGLEGLIGQ
jgi:hypothetical protein